MKKVVLIIVGCIALFLFYISNSEDNKPKKISKYDKCCCIYKDKTTGLKMEALMSPDACQWYSGQPLYGQTDCNETPTLK
jgi:hypothetical protein